MSDVTVSERSVHERLVAAERKLAALEAVRTRPRRRPRAARLAGPLLLVLLLALVPAALGATDRFGDVPQGAFYHDDATAIADAGVTQGCGGGNYCPGDAVTRGELASFLARLGGLGNNPPVANAATAVSATTAASAVNAINAVNAQTAAVAQGVAPGAVGPAGLSAAGSTAGQVLTSDGTTVSWQTAGGAVTPVARYVGGSVGSGGGTVGDATATCLPGEVVVGGGFGLPSDVSASVLQNMPTSTTQWHVMVKNGQANGFTFTAYALCIPGAN